MIAGDLFHRQPLLRDLKEVDYLFSQMPDTDVVMIAGNHDYIRKDSYYRTFSWSENVHMLKEDTLTCVEFPAYDTAVYGCSYHARERTDKPYENMYARHRQPYEILLLHGGDDKHMPIKKEEIMDLGYDYVALGHIHKPQELVPGMMAFPGAPEAIDKNDTGAHGFIEGEITTKGCRTRFVPFSAREYRDIEVSVDKDTTIYELKKKIGEEIKTQGEQHLYKITLTGFADPDLLIDPADFDELGNIVELTDETAPIYHFEQIYQQNKSNILGGFIESFAGCSEGSVEYEALLCGVKALMDTRRK